jgi:hypothetical protein
MSKIIIQLQGGLVQDVFLRGRGKPTKYVTIDEDEDADPKDQTEVKLGRGKTYRAVVGCHEVSRLPQKSDVAHIVNKYLKEKGK